jgi:RecA/RadA recombinase
MRKKIGITFGDPSTMSGGHGLRHEFSLLLRLVKKALSDNDKKKYHDPTRKKELVSRHSFSIRKEKVLTLSGVGEFVIIKEDFPDLGLRKGSIDDYHTVLTYAKEAEIIHKEGKTWRYFDHKAKRLDDIKELWKKKPAQYRMAQIEIVRRVKQRLAEVADG